MRRPRRRLTRRGWAVVLTLAALIALSVAQCARSCRGTAATSPEKDTLTHKHLNDSLINAMSDSPDIALMDSTIKKYLRRWEINGAQLAISRHDSLIYAKGFGWADREKREPMTPGHIMRIASVSKLVTAVGIMSLSEMGKLRLSDKVFGPQGILNDTLYTNTIRDKRHFDITVEQLLRHQAGFTNYAGDPMFSTRYIMMQNHLAAPPDHRTLLSIILKRHLGYTPGTAQRYCNVGYMLLSMIIEKVTGQPYEAFMQQNVLQPAGCYDFHIAGNYLQDRLPHEVRYYMHQGSTPVYEYNNSGRLVEKCYGENDLPRLAGAGAWVASAAELCRLVATIDLQPQVPDILSPESVRLMTRPMPDYGFSIGWNFTPQGRPWTRTGSLGGTSALVLKYPDGECWVLITNTSTWKGHDFSHDTIALFEKLRQKYGPLMPRRNLF